MKVSMRGVSGKWNSTNEFYGFMNGEYWDGFPDVFSVTFEDILEAGDWLRENVRECMKEMYPRTKIKRLMRIKRNARFHKLGIPYENRDWIDDTLPF